MGEIRSARCTHEATFFKTSSFHSLYRKEQQQQQNTRVAHNCGALQGAPGGDGLMYARGPWLGVQDTIVGESDPALPLGRKIDFRAIKHTMKNSFSSS